MALLCTYRKQQPHRSDGHAAYSQMHFTHGGMLHHGASAGMAFGKPFSVQFRVTFGRRESNHCASHEHLGSAVSATTLGQLCPVCNSGIIAPSLPFRGNVNELAKAAAYPIEIGISLPGLQCDWEFIAAVSCVCMRSPAEPGRNPRSRGGGDYSQILVRDATAVPAGSLQCINTACV